MDINAQNNYYYTPLHLAVINNNLEAVNELIRLGADIDITDNLGKTAYFFAKEQKNDVIMSALDKAGANQKIIPKEIKGEYFGMPKPGSKPEIFAPGLVSTMKGFEFAGTFSPDNNEYFFTQRDLGFGQRIRYFKREKDKWSNIDFAPFTYDCFEFEPFVTVDGNKVYYGSRRPLPEDTVINKRTAIWMSEKINLKWSPPKLVGEQMMYVTLSQNGTLYTTDLSGKVSGLINRVYQDGKFKEGVSLGDNVNFMSSTAHPYIAPDESYVIFDAQPDGFEAGARFFISFRKKDGTWTDPAKLSDEINKGDVMCPKVSPDGKYFFFNSNKDGYSDIYWISADFIKKMKKNILK
ncbi:MAG: hypothetical protein HC831_08880 [Chloroflexia bacterium]|nr:hypothetical protein [Chloroflexia bacterium]